MKIEKKTLANNLDVLFIDAPGQTTSTIQFWFRAGSALEEDSDQGIAHFLEHMFFKGTSKRPGAAIAHEIETFGGEVNAFTSFDYTCYYINSPVDNLLQATDILLDMVANPLFGAKDFKAEREVVFEEYLRSIDNPNQFAFAKIMDNSFTGKYAHPILGRPETIKNFSKKQLITFRKNHYNTNNCLLVIAGDLKERKKIISQIEKFHFPKGKENSFEKFTLKNKTAIEVHKKDVRQATFTICLPAPSFNDEHAASEDLAMNCFAHGETSRAYQNLVHKNSLATSVSGSTMFFIDGGIHFLRVVLPEENLSKLYPELLSIIEDIEENGFDSDEINKIQNQYLASKLYDLESIESYAFAKGHGFAQNGDIEAEDKFIKQIERSNKFAVNNSFKKIWSGKLQFSLQLPNSASVSEHKKLLSKFAKELDKLKKKDNQKKLNKVTNSNFDQQAKLIELKKGIKLFYRQNTMTPTFVFHAYLRGGLTEETMQNNGQYHLLSSLLTKGYNKKNYHEIKKNLENMSASLNGFSGKNAYGLTMHGQTAHIEQLFNHFWNSFLKPDIPEKWLKHEKELIRRELENQKEDPIKLCFQNFGKHIFNDHPYAFNVLGSQKSVKRIKRLDLQKLHSTNLQQKEILFTYCGDLPLDELLEILTPYIEKIPSRNEKTVKIKKYSSKHSQKQKIELPREQSHLLLGRESFPLGTQNDLMLKMLTIHLSGQSSDLFVTVRDKLGLCYAAQAIQFTAIEGGYWAIYMGTSNDKVEQALMAMKTLLGQLQKKGVTSTELKKIKSMLEGQNKINIQTNGDYANIYSIPILQNKGMDFFYHNNQFIKNVNLQDFNKFLKNFLDYQFNTVIVGK